MLFSPPPPTYLWQPMRPLLSWSSIMLHATMGMGYCDSLCNEHRLQTTATIEKSKPYGHIKYDIVCHMVFYVIRGTFQMMFLMNKWTNTITDDGWLHPLAKTLPSLVNNLWRNIDMDDWDLDGNHLVSDSNCNTVHLIIPQIFYKEWQMMLG